MARIVQLDDLTEKISVSHRALAIARAVDRLAPGFTYDLEIVKPDMPALEWRVEIVRQEKIQTLNLTYAPE